LNDDILDKREAGFFLFMYLLFLAYVIVLSLNLF